jgi:hypothetical protein
MPRDTRPFLICSFFKPRETESNCGGIALDLRRRYLNLLRSMKSPRVLILITTALLLASSSEKTFAADESAKPAVPMSRIDLFNGKDFSGWTFFTKNHADLSRTWDVTNGIVHSLGKPTGYLRTETDYANYKLTVEWRFVKIAPKADNGGFLVHMQLPPDKLWPPCIQCQGKHAAVGDLFLMGGAESKEHQGKDMNTALPKTVDAEKPVGEWNTCEMICSGNSVKVLVNGKLVNETTECTVSSGKIGIQDEGAEFEIRRMFIEPLK